MRHMSDYSVELVLKEWVDESRTPEPIQFSYGKGELFIYTSSPGYLIGKAGTLYNKYKDKLISEFSDLKSVRIVVRTHDDMRARISYLCSKVPVSTYSTYSSCVGCPYNNDPDSWCRKGKVSDIPGTHIYEVLKNMEGVIDV